MYLKLNDEKGKNAIPKKPYALKHKVVSIQILKKIKVHQKLSKEKYKYTKYTY